MIYRQMEMEQGLTKRKEKSWKVIQVRLTYIQCGEARIDEEALV